jgi:hypothetical protein
MTETAQLEGLLEKFKFTSPVSASVRKRLIKSRARVLKFTLKEVGAYSVWFGLVLFIILKLRKIGFKFAITFANIAAITAVLVASGAVAAGAYVVVKQYQDNISAIPISEKSETFNFTNDADNALFETQETQKEVTVPKDLPKVQEKAPTYEIFLYSGKKYVGSIESRGVSYNVNTSNGQVSIPANQIKLIKRAKE